jgi:hypothetical protein
MAGTQNQQPSPSAQETHLSRGFVHGEVLTYVTNNSGLVSASCAPNNTLVNPAESLALSCRTCAFVAAATLLVAKAAICFVFFAAAES